MEYSAVRMGCGSYSECRRQSQEGCAAKVLLFFWIRFMHDTLKRLGRRRSKAKWFRKGLYGGTVNSGIHDWDLETVCFSCGCGRKAMRSSKYSTKGTIFAFPCLCPPAQERQMSLHACVLHQSDTIKWTVCLFSLNKCLLATSFCSHSCQVIQFQYLASWSSRVRYLEFCI